MAGKNNSAQGATKKGRAVLFANSGRTFKNVSAYAGVENASALSKREVVAAETVGSLTRKVVPGKRLHDFAPSAAKVSTVENAEGNAVATSSSTADAAPAPAVADIAVFQVMQAAKLCDNTVNREMRRVVKTIASITPEVVAAATTAKIVRRVVCSGKRDRMNGIILGTCEAAAKLSAAAKGESILIVEPTDDDAKRLVDLYKTMGVPAALIIDEPAADDKASKKRKDVALSALAAPVVADPKTLKKNRFLSLAAANRTASIAAPASDAPITFCLAKAPKVAVTSLSSIFTSVNDQHIRQYQSVIVDEPQPKDEELYATLSMMLRNVKAVFVVASTPELALNACVDPVCGKKSTMDDAVEADEEGATGSSSSNLELPISFVTSEGLPRLQTLLALLQNSGRTNKIVVQCATLDGAIFLCDLLYALNTPEEGNFRLFCDSENKSDKAQLATDVATISERFDRVNVAEGTGAVLLTAHGLLPKSGTLLVQYDPIVSVMNFVVNIISPAAANVAAYQTYQSDVVAMAAANNEARVSVPFKAPAAANGFQYRHIITFFYPSEEVGALTLITDALSRLTAPATPWILRPEKIKQVSVNTAAATLLTLQSVKDLHKKVFAIQNNAYNAYRSLMQVYTRLHPKTVYSVEKLNLNAVAAQFGYEELPLLDLRTKNTQFRPKLDVFRIAAIKNKHTMKRVRADADANIVGAGPDEEWMADAAPFKAKDE
eukprot:GILI01005120.1.p1 GENE.GILI01005120.1~~GILI01005120.1.p1  ORF type:complete len:720 (+),score=249.65 GILI01005120.1:43-2202(+)